MCVRTLHVSVPAPLIQPVHADTVPIMQTGTWRFSFHLLLEFSGMAMGFKAIGSIGGYLSGHREHWGVLGRQKLGGQVEPPRFMGTHVGNRWAERGPTGRGEATREG